MKICIKLLIIPLLLLAGCTSREAIRTGDLLFVGIPGDYSLDEGDMASAISDATGDGRLNIIHVGILDVAEDGVYLIDATIKRGVDRHPLDTFYRDFTLKDGTLPVLEVKRLGGAGKAGAEFARRAVERARNFTGIPYDVHFLPDNGAFYCSELVHDCYLDESGAPIFHTSPMNFKNADGEMPVYWEQLFARLGEPVPQDVEGTSPQGLREEPVLQTVPIQLPYE